MLVTIHESEPEEVETGPGAPVDAHPSEGGPEEVGTDPCACDACQALSRDEMWIRWA